MVQIDPIQKLQEEIKSLRLLLIKKELELSNLIKTNTEVRSNSDLRLNAAEICRYSRQIIVPSIGIKGQLALKNSSILIVGTGGLGCPAAIYLAAAGVGCIGLVDYDCVELHNLHRQILHSESYIDKPKVDSALAALQSINGGVKIDTYNTQLSSSNAVDIISKYDVVLDATDNVPTRYLLSDACVLTNRPLISGGALRSEGQLTVYHYDENSPCYRCLYPVPPPPTAVQNCGSSGVLGPVPGVIGTLQAMEAIKVIIKDPNVLSSKLLLYEAFRTSFRTVTIRGKNKQCPICSDSPTITKLIDYETFCCSAANDKDSQVHLLESCDRITVQDLSKLLQSSSESTVYIDVRSPEEFEMCCLPKFVNVPITQLTYSLVPEDLSKELNLPGRESVVVICRRGNDSQKAVEKLKNWYGNENIVVKDVIGGLHEWKKKVDSNFPTY